jgi:cysteine synthase A
MAIDTIIEVTDIRVHPVGPAESPTISTGHKRGQASHTGHLGSIYPGSRRSHPFGSSHRGVWRRLGLDGTDAGLQSWPGRGISSGCNFLTTLKVQEELGPTALVATVFADDNKKYLSTDVTHTEPVGPDHLAPEVALTGISALQRVCFGYSLGV